jgi:hypothetical protein
MPPEPHVVKGFARRKVSNDAADMLRLAVGAGKVAALGLWGLASISEENVRNLTAAAKALHTSLQDSRQGVGTTSSLRSESKASPKGQLRFAAEDAEFGIPFLHRPRARKTVFREG